MSDGCSSDLSPSPACGRRWRKAPDEGGERRELPCLMPLAFHSKIKSTLSCARVPSSALRALSPVNGRRASVCSVTPSGITTALQVHPGRSTLSRRGCQETIDEVFRSDEHTSELQSLMRISYAVLCFKNTY